MIKYIKIDIVTFAENVIKVEKNMTTAHIMQRKSAPKTTDCKNNTGSIPPAFKISKNIKVKNNNRNEIVETTALAQNLHKITVLRLIGFAKSG